MPEAKTIKKAKQKRREGKAPSTQAGEFVHEEIKHIREGKHGARSAKQAIAIGLSKARKAGVPLPPRKSKSSASTKKKPRTQESRTAQPSARRSNATLQALKKEPRSAASHRALSAQAHRAARTPASLQRVAIKAIKTKGSRVRGAVQKAALTHRAG